MAVVWVVMLLAYAGSIIGSFVLVAQRCSIIYGVLTFLGNIVATYLLAWFFAPKGTNEGSWIGLLAIPVVAVINIIVMLILLL